MEARGPFVVTGSGGFVGCALMGQLGSAPRTLHLGLPDWREQIEAASFEESTVIHLAARVHAPEGEDRLHDHDNRDKTAVLAKAAASHGARRFVFLSTVKAIGEETHDAPFTPATPPGPMDAYGRSKRAAELAIIDAARTSSMECVIVRAPLVLGAGAKANAASLLRMCDSPWPLPFGAVANRRSFVHVRDLARLLLACSGSPRAAGRTYLAAHRVPFSTPRLIRAMRDAVGRPARLFRVDPAWLEATARIAGRGAAMQRLTRSLEVDPSAAEADLGWAAELDLERAARDMVHGDRAGLRS